MNKYSVVIRAGKNDIRTIPVEADDFTGHVDATSYIRFYNQSKSSGYGLVIEFNSKRILYIKKEE